MLVMSWKNRFVKWVRKMSSDTDSLSPQCFNHGCNKQFESVDDMVAVPGGSGQSPRHFCEGCAERVRRGPPLTDGGQTENMNETAQNRLGKNVPVEETDTECPCCGTRNLVKPRSELKQCPECLYVNNPGYMGNEGRDFDLTHRQGRLLLRAFGCRFDGTHGDIENRLRKMCEELGLDRQELNSFLADLRHNTREVSERDE